MDGTTWLGLVAGALTTAAFVPQVVHTWRRRSARDVSLGMFAILCAGIVLWIVYGLLTASMPVVVANGITLVLAGAVLAMKLRFG